MDGYNSTDRPMKKEIRRMMVDFLLCIGFSLMLWRPAGGMLPPGPELRGYVWIIDAKAEI